MCFGLVLEFPCLGTGIYGGCGIVCLRLPWGFNPWIVPLRFGAGSPGLRLWGAFEYSLLSGPVAQDSL